LVIHGGMLSRLFSTGMQGCTRLYYDYLRLCRAIATQPRYNRVNWRSLLKAVARTSATVAGADAALHAVTKSIFIDVNLPTATTDAHNHAFVGVQR
jgi:hypothetical protein